MSMKKLRVRQQEKIERAMEILKARLSKSELIEFTCCYGEAGVHWFWKRLKKEAGIEEGKNESYNKTQ